MALCPASHFQQWLTNGGVSADRDPEGEALLLTMVQGAKAGAVDQLARLLLSRGQLHDERRVIHVAVAHTPGLLGHPWRCQHCRPTAGHGLLDGATEATTVLLRFHFGCELHHCWVSDVGAWTGQNKKQQYYSRTSIKRPSIKRSPIKVPEFASLNYCKLDLYLTVTSIKRTRSPFRFPNLLNSLCFTSIKRSLTQQ